MRVLSHSLSSLSRSGIRKIMDMAVQMEDAIHMEVGDPGFDTPAHVQEAAIQAINGGFTHYTMHAGTQSLRELILRKVQEENDINAEYEQVGVTPGGAFAMAAAFMAIAEVGDEVLVPDPGWPFFVNQPLALNLKPVRYHLNRESGFQPDLEEIESLITQRTRALVINSPGNPTGVIFPQETIRALLDLCTRHDIYLISDEVYEKIIFEGEHFSPASFDPNGRVIAVYSVSKTYAMTGWRIGYYVAPTDVARSMGRALETHIACPSSISQKAAEAALKGPQGHILEMVRAYAECKDVCVAALEDAQLDFVHPQGTFFLMVDIKETGMDSYDFSTELLRESGVAVAPGLAFGPYSDNLVRLSFCISKKDVTDGIKRLCNFIKS